ncbi:hypothetical protein [Halocatena halophila]|uniref:hypothetical protein n=1 Tax=Halocatena halophila TaxID=2814576 RepID=UPI002ED4F2A2
MTELLPELVASIPEMAQEFAALFSASAPQAALMAVGGILVGVSVLVFGYLTLGAVSTLLLPTPGRGRTHQ